MRIDNFTYSDRAFPFGILDELS
ncbi:hypothetical protein BVI2075_350013 [Burkholderia vietnamiensis]|nr:hypothetical protein BVI2075_350013 [Burkholderia vietnamiensis]